MERRSFFDVSLEGSLDIPDQDLRNVVGFRCGVCDADLSVCHHEERYMVPCSACGSKFDVLWTPGVVGITLVEVGGDV